MKNDRLTINAAGLNRILKAVGKENYPSNIDRDALSRGFDECVYLYEEAKKYHTKKFRAAQERQLRVVLARAKRLRQLMKDDGVWNDSLWRRHFDSKPGTPLLPRTAIDGIVHLVSAELEGRLIDYGTTGQGYYEGTFRLHSPFEWLFGDWLVVVYKLARFPNGRSRKGLVSKNGPYLRFAKAFAKELKIKNSGRPYKTGSYIKAVETVFSPNITRRKPWYEPYLLPDGGNAPFFKQGPRVLRDALRSVMASPKERSVGQN